jgi:hypothetical protein
MSKIYEFEAYDSCAIQFALLSISEFRRACSTC